MSSENVLASATASASATITAYDPTKTPGAQPPKNLKDFNGQVIVIYEAKITKGDDYNNAVLMIKPEGSDKAIEVSSYSKFILAAVEDIINRNLLPTKVKPIAAGRALFFQAA